MFENAKQIYIKNKREAINFQAGFKCKFNADLNKNYSLRVTGASLYAVYLNNEFIFYGPARAAHGYVRCDEVELNIKEGINTLCIEVAGYNCPTYYTMNIKSFIQAEVFENGASIKYTGRDFMGISLDKLRKQRVYRYSYQRSFVEVYNMDNSSIYTNWKIAEFNPEPVSVYETEEKIIPRNMPNPIFKTDNSMQPFQYGRFEIDGKIGDSQATYVNNLAGWSGFEKYEIDDKIIRETNGLYIEDNSKDLNDNRYVLYNLEKINTGFICSSITAFEDSEIYIIFSEKLDENKVIDVGKESREHINVIKYSLKASELPYNLQSFEPYSLKYTGVLLRKGRIRVDKLFVREYSYPYYENTQMVCSDEKLNTIFEAAKNGFRQNTLDCYMDCPGRERAGWLCDSYFTAQSERMLAGTSCVEEQFLKNFVLAKDFPNIPVGMLPMCYPAGRLDFIPQWAMWYVIEFAEYLKRKKDDKTFFKDIIYNLIEYFDRFKNKYGLLNKLDGWNFIEWSAANDYVEKFDVSYPTNMLYSYMLKRVSGIYDDAELKARAYNMKETIIEYAFNGEDFADGGMYNEHGVLETGNNITEACQYYAVFSEIADIKDSRFNVFFDRIFNFYGISREENKINPEIEYADVFIGLTMRMEILGRVKKYDLLLNDIKSVYYQMAKKTGTFWEHKSGEQSLNHGFLSVVGVYMVKALAGITEINYVDKIIYMTEEYSENYEYDMTVGLDSGGLHVTNKSGKRTVCLTGEYEVKYV